MPDPFDAVIVGSGPNGLAAAITLAQRGLRVQVREAAAEPGGGTRTDALTLPGFLHDVCSAVHPLGIGSPFFRQLPLHKHGLTWIQPPAPLAHPLDDGSAVLLHRSTRATGDNLDPGDGPTWQRLMDPFVGPFETLVREALGPLRVPRHPLLLARFGLRAVLPASLLVHRAFRGQRARALFGGIAAHATLSLRRPPSAAFGFVLGIAGHAVGWPIPRGGSAAIAGALVSYLRTLGGEVVLNARVDSLDDLPRTHAVLLDLTVGQALRVAGDRFPAEYRAELERFQYGLGTFKMDWAMDAPIPWTSPTCAQAATVHVGGTFEEIDASRESDWAGVPAERPYVLVVQPSLFDPTRAPAGQHVAWAYCHLPNGSSADMSDRIEAQIERFAPGFRDRIIARHAMGPAALQAHNANLIGGDINGGEVTLRQLFLRPAVRPFPYRTPLPHVYLCSSSTPPGGAVHGLCGYHAARTALRHSFGG